MGRRGQLAAALRRRARTWPAPLVAGALVAASLPPSSWWPLAPLGIALLARSNAGAPWPQRLRNGFLAGVAQFSLGCLWAQQFTGAGYAVLVVVEAAFVALACAAAPGGRGRLPALAGLLTLAEWARDSWPFGGLPLGGIALGQVAGPLLPLARLGGPLLIVAATCLAGVGLDAVVDGIHALWRGRGRATPALAASASHVRRPGQRLVAGALSLVAIGATAAVASVAPDGGAPRAHLSVAAVQGGGRRGLNSLEVPSASVLAAELAATGQIEQRTGLVLWPEDAVALGGPLRGSPVESLLSATARRLGTTLLVGVTEPAGPGRFRNEAVVFAPSGREVASYEKVHPVPFGEYVPLRSLFSHFVGLSAVPRDAVVGHGSGMVSTPAGRLAVLLSYETFFTERGRSGVRAGGELVIVPTNTASYSTAQVPDQELAASRLQAVGTGRDLVQVAATGFSAVVDNHGRLLRVSRLGVRAVVRAKVALRTGETPYDQLGELPALLAAIALLAGGWFLAGTGLSWRWRWPSPRWASSRRAAC